MNSPAQPHARLRVVPGTGPGGGGPVEIDLPPVGTAWFQAGAKVQGAYFKSVATAHLHAAGPVRIDAVHRAGLHHIDGIITTPAGARIVFIAHGSADDTKTAGLRRVDTVAKLGHACLVLAATGAAPCLVITSHLPLPDTQAAAFLAEIGRLTGGWLLDVVATSGDLAGYQRLRRILHADHPQADSAAPWRHPNNGTQLALDLFPATPRPLDPAPLSAEADF